MRHVLLLLLREPAQLLLELRLLDARRDENVVQRPARLRRRLGDRRDVLHVVLVGLRLRVVLAALDPEHEQDDDEDRERDQTDEPEDRRQAARRARRATRAAWPALGALRRANRSAALRDRLFVRLVEEVELEVVLSCAQRT